LEQTAKRVEELTRSLMAELNLRFERMLAAQAGELQARAEKLAAEMVERLTPALQARADEVRERTQAEVERSVAPQIEKVQSTLQELAARESAAASALQQERAALQEAAREAAQNAVVLFQGMVQQLEKGFEDSTRAAVARCVEEIEAKSTEITHTTFESLYKSSDWYQKKAQTAMHTALEKAIAEAATHLREKAAEISGLFASELDHYSRSYVEHTQGLLEEASKEMLGSAREQIHETVDATTAKLSDAAHRVAEEKAESLRRSTDGAVQQATARLAVHIEDLQQEMAAHAQRAAKEFEHRLQERLREELLKAGHQLQAQMIPILDSWKSETHAAQQQLLDAMSRHGEESVEKYRERLENVSNTWMLAAVTNLSQHSKNLLDSIVRTGEEQLRQACAQVLSDMGDKIGEQLSRISEQLKSPPADSAD
jgi:endonuclease III-like uncharacterized protein